MPIKVGWGDPDPRPWGCILTKQKEEGEGYGGESYEWYCDKCPVRRICPSKEKRFSK